jgi:hypothetical protein
MTNSYKIFVEESEGKIPLMKSWDWWEDSIKVGFKEMMWECGLDSGMSGLIPVAGCCEHGYEPTTSFKGGTFLGKLTDPRHLKDSKATKISIKIIVSVSFSYGASELVAEVLRTASLSSYYKTLNMIISPLTRFQF